MLVRGAILSTYLFVIGQAGFCCRKFRQGVGVLALFSGCLNSLVDMFLALVSLFLRFCKVFPTLQMPINFTIENLKSKS